MFRVTILFIYSKRDIKIIELVFINNITLISKYNFVMTSIDQDLQQYFKLHDLELTSFFLLFQIKQDLEAYIILLSQSHYINKLLKHFGIDDYNLVKISLFLETNLSGLSPTIFKQYKINSVYLLSAVGFLQYLMTMTQLDIAYTIFYLDRFNYNLHLTY